MCVYIFNISENIRSIAMTPQYVSLDADLFPTDLSLSYHGTCDNTCQSVLNFALKQDAWWITDEIRLD